MTNRYENALFIDAGACNPVGIAGTLHETLLEIVRSPGYTGTRQQCEDPAVRLIVQQLAFICGMGDGSMSENYTAAREACTIKAKETT